MISSASHLSVPGDPRRPQVMLRFLDGR
jgi:hypothetical protein